MKEKHEVSSNLQKRNKEKMKKWKSIRSASSPSGHVAVQIVHIGQQVLSTCILAWN